MLVNYKTYIDDDRKEIMSISVVLSFKRYVSICMSCKLEEKCIILISTVVRIKAKVILVALF